MHPYLLLLAGASVTSAACAGCLFAREPGRRSNQLAGLLLFGAAYWAICELSWNLAPSAEIAVRLARLSAPGWTFIGPVVLHLFLLTALEPWRRMWRLLPWLYGVSCAFTAAAWFTPWLMTHAVRTSWGWAYEVGPLFPLLYLVTMVGVGAGIAVVLRTFREVYSPADQQQRPWVLIGAGVPIFVASITDALLPVLGIQFPRLGTTSFAILGAIAVSSVFRFGYSILTPGTFADEILSALPEGVALLRRDERIRNANEGFARLSGYPRQQLDGMHLGNLLSQTLGEPSAEPLEIDCELVRASGERIPVAASSSLLCDRQNYAIGQVLVVRDLREVVDLRSRLVMSARLAAVGELAAGIAHEINNPIAFVRSNLSQLQSHWKMLRSELEAVIRARELEAVVDEGNELIEESIDGVDRAAEIVRGVKGFSHGGGGARELADVTELLEDALLVATPQLRGRARIERVYCDVPQIRCAPQELKQVFLNLIVNAGQAVGEGGTIRLATQSRGVNVCIDVEDDGDGIPPEIIDRIFDPFFTTKRVGEGTGLGLGIAYQIVRRHEGELTVESSPGQGSHFHVCLPLGGEKAEGG